MNMSWQALNKALVFGAFNTLFNKRNYAVAERFWSPSYIQHSAHIGPVRSHQDAPSDAQIRARNWSSPRAIM